MVIIVSEGNRAKWPLGRITKLHPDEHGVVRTVEVFTRGNHLLKTVNKLVPLESAVCDNAENMEPIREVSTIEEIDTHQVQVPSTNRPRRRAAVRAEAERLQLLADDQL